MNELLRNSSRDDTACLIVVDMQADFFDDGALPVKGGEDLVSPIAELTREFRHLVFTQDSHPAHHISFASSYPGRKAFDVLKISDVREGSISPFFSNSEVSQYLSRVSNQEQVLWPDHCVTGSDAWQIDSRLNLEKAFCILRKGTQNAVDSFSGFRENDGSDTGLDAMLKARGIRKVFVCGLAGDYCVFWTAKDAAQLGFEVYFLEDYTKYVGFPPSSRENALKVMDELGVVRL